MGGDSGRHRQVVQGPRTEVVECPHFAGDRTGRSSWDFLRRWPCRAGPASSPESARNGGVGGSVALPQGTAWAFLKSVCEAALLPTAGGKPVVALEVENQRRLAPPENFLGDLITTLWRRLTGRKGAVKTPSASTAPNYTNARSVDPTQKPKPAATADTSSATRTASATSGRAPPPSSAPAAPLRRPSTTKPKPAPEEPSVEAGEEAREREQVRVLSHGGHSRFLGGPVASGGTSTVFEIVDTPNLVAKVFSDDYLAKFGSVTEEKVKAQHEKAADLTEYDQIIWPRTSIYRPDGQWIGYSMRKTDGVLLNRMVLPRLQEKYFPHLDRFHVVDILVQIVDGVIALHRLDTFVGDFNFSNFVVNSGPSRVFFIDTDGFQVDNHSCLFVKPEYLPPEHIDKNANTVTRDEKSDSFSLSILLFQALMKMRHPYDTVGGGDLIDNLKNGHFPYGLGGMAPGRDGAIPEGPWYVMWSHLPWGLKNAFIQMFTEGARKPELRPSVDEWRKLLTKYGGELGRGYHERDLLPAQAKTAAYRGRVQPGG